MEQLWSLMPDVLGGLPGDAAAARRRRACSRSSSARSSRRCGSHLSPRCAAFAGVLDRDRAEHPADARLHLHGVRAADARRPPAVHRPRVHRAHVLHVAVRRRGAALRHQRRAGRAGRGGAQHRARIRADGLAGRPAAGLPHDGPAADQRLHRAHQEHLGRRRVLRRRAVRHDPSARERQRQHRACRSSSPPPPSTWSSPSRWASSPGSSRSAGWCSDERHERPLRRARAPKARRHLADPVDRRARAAPRGRMVWS